jgi:hypothetical protein
VTDRTLLDIIDHLTIEHPYPARIENRTRWVRRDPLIRQLRELVASSLTGGNGTTSQAGRLPFDAEALEQYDKLERQILTELGTVSDQVPHLLPEENLRAWYSRIYATLDEDTEQTLMDVWWQWQTYIEAKLEAPVVLELMRKVGEGRDAHHVPYECPECGMGWFVQVTNSGPDGKGGRWYEKEKRVALVATYRPDGQGGLDRSAVECGCCGWRVTGTRIRGFAWSIEEQERLNVASTA